MANFVKKKARLSALLIALVSLVVILRQSDYYNHHTAQNEFIWNSDSNLKYSDFQQKVPSWNLEEFDASIYSRIDLAPDSLDSLLVATFVNRSRSWFDTGSYSQDLLTHEEYHIRLTDYHTRTMRRYLKQHEILNKSDIVEELGIFMQMVSSDQSQYDEETEHSLNTPVQKYWEYRIDSMHTTLDSGNGIWTDLFSGISGRFPYRTESLIESDIDVLNSEARMVRYDLKFEITTQSDFYIDIVSLYDTLISRGSADELLNIHSEIVKWKGYDALRYNATDTFRSLVYNYLFVVREPFLHHVSVSMPIEFENNQYYIRMRDSFFESIRIESRGDYWIPQMRKALSSSVLRLEDWTATSGVRNDCVDLLSTADRSFLFHYPIFIKEQNEYLVPIKFVKHQPDEIAEILIVSETSKGSRTFGASSVQKDTQYLIFPADAVQVGELTWIGYTLKSDSLKSCKKLYNTAFSLPPVSTFLE